MAVAVQKRPEPAMCTWSVDYLIGEGRHNEKVMAHECRVNDNGDLIFIEYFDGRENVSFAYAVTKWIRVEPDNDPHPNVFDSGNQA